MTERDKIVEMMVDAARKAVTGYPHTQTITFQMRAALAALEQAGYAVVPVEPSDEMEKNK
jgi:predicted CoA-binding protein